MKCPNGCGELVELEKPALVPPTEDALDELPNWHQEDKRFYQAILRICPKCGYNEAEELTEEQFDNFEEYWIKKKEKKS